MSEALPGYIVGEWTIDAAHAAAVGGRDRQIAAPIVLAVLAAAALILRVASM